MIIQDKQTQGTSVSTNMIRMNMVLRDVLLWNLVTRYNDQTQYYRKKLPE